MLGLLGWCTGITFYPEQVGIGVPQAVVGDEAQSFCYNVRESMAQLATTNNTFDGTILIPSDGHSFGQARDQYASVTFAQAMAPSVIVLVESESDVQAAVKFASQCEYSVSIRSGGHSYLGTSSCDSSKGQCLQIDVTGLNIREILPAQAKIGPGNRLRDAAEFLKQNGRFVPTGECPGVALGGHMQTGGFGLFARHFGPFVNRVGGFRIVLADGEVHDIVTPSEETSTLNDDIFYAVLGGASGSWGVVTEMTLNTIADEDFFSVYWKLGYWWDTPEDTEGIVNMMRTFSEMANEKIDDTRWSIHASVVGAKNLPGLGNRIQLEFSWVAPMEQKDEYDFDFFQKIDSACTGCTRFRYINVTEPLSQIWRHRYLRTLIDETTGREFPLPYTRSMQSLQAIPQPDGMESIVRATAALMPGRFSPHFVISQITTINEANINRALPWQQDKIGITLDYFYIPPTEWVIDHEQRALNFAKVLRDASDGEDHRMYWAAFDNPVMEKDWPKYFDNEEKFRRLQGIKQKYDPTNIFQNKMSIPMPTEGELDLATAANMQAINGTATTTNNSFFDQEECAVGSLVESCTETS